MKVLGSKAVIAAYIPAFSNQAIHFTGDDMGGDKTMVMTLLYILIAIMAFVFAVTTNNTITKRSGSHRNTACIRLYQRRTAAALSASSGTGDNRSSNYWKYTWLYRI